MGRLVAVTFTEKAAGELKLRLRQELENGAAASPSCRRKSARPRRGPAQLEEAHVSTIHGFCADLLRERPVEAGVDPLFRVLTEGSGAAAYDEAFAAWFQDALKEMPEGVRRSLRRSAPGPRRAAMDDDGPVDRCAAPAGS